MVEGYTDVIAMHQCGLENVVANSGTALSNHQIRLLHRFTPNIVLLYDGDEAGIHAAMRGTDMLLAEGMNIKVLLLPDGDDPDSFSRKHTAEEFKAYIEQHQTDFIQFKTDLLLKGVTDPQKRSEAVSNILKSVSVIPDKLKRDTYLSECSHRFNVNEQALVTTVNTYIQRDKEEKQKERERGEASTAGGQRDELIVPIGLHSAQEQTTEVERLLIQNIVRHGEEVIYEGVETDDGQLINLNVAQYIDYDLGADNLEFSNPLFNRILQEAVEHSADPGFKADLYFMQHPDPEVSSLAANLGMDRHQLSRSFQVNSNANLLRQRIEHLILDFRMDIVSQHLKELQQKMKVVGSDMTQIKEIMDDYKQTQELRNALARQRGSDVIV
jgi:DNA primase